MVGDQTNRVAFALIRLLQLAYMTVEVCQKAHGGGGIDHLVIQRLVQKGGLGDVVHQGVDRFQLGKSLTGDGAESAKSRRIGQTSIFLVLVAMLDVAFQLPSEHRLIFKYRCSFDDRIRCILSFRLILCISLTARTV